MSLPRPQTMTDGAFLTLAVSAPERKREETLRSEKREAIVYCFLLKKSFSLLRAMCSKFKSERSIEPFLKLQKMKARLGPLLFSLSHGPISETIRKQRLERLPLAFWLPPSSLFSDSFLPKRKVGFIFPHFSPPLSFLTASN